METFGQKIKQLRKAKRITQLELAEKIGVDFTYVSKFENDKTVRPPAESTIRKLADVLETNAEELILLAKKIPQNLQETVVKDSLAFDFLRTVNKLNQNQRAKVREIIDSMEDKN